MEYSKNVTIFTYGHKSRSKSVLHIQYNVQLKEKECNSVTFLLLSALLYCLLLSSEIILVGYYLNCNIFAVDLP